MEEHDPKLVEALARGIDPNAWASITDGCPAEIIQMREIWRQQAARVATAALDAIKAEGFVVVPVEPTDEMLEAGVAAVRDFRAACEADGSNVAILDNPVGLSVIAIRAAIAACPGAGDAGMEGEL